MSEKIENKKIFTQTNSADGQITSSTDIDLIKRNDGNVWVMNHIFLNPDQHDDHELSLLINDVISYIKTSSYPLWPLDPIAIKYFEKHPELNDLWYHKPYDKK